MWLGFNVISSIEEPLTMPKAAVMQAFQTGYLVVATAALITALIASTAPLVRLPERT
ncbi:hypothetical protein CAG64_22485 [Vibrio sp. V38_P2S17PM301]|nr:MULTISPECIES: hypothetical protein [unclassified Vibrio]NAX28217.1 hypothetical protein [Vibrio sp. V38_P2S17PM301]